MTVGGGRSRWVVAVCITLGAVLLLAVGAGLRPILIPAAPSESGSVQLTPTEIGFAQDMSTHHEQAIFMVHNLGDDVAPEIAELGRKIESAQLMEIGTMRGWLTLFDEQWTSTTPMAWMHPQAAGSGHSHTGGVNTVSAPVSSAPMPGMATWTEINALGAASGRDAEILFLQLMARHHEGGIEMGSAALEADLSDPVRDVVQSMVREQVKELGYIGLLLGQREASMLPYP